MTATPRILKYRKRVPIKLRKEWEELYFVKHIGVRSIADTYQYPPYTVYRVLEGRTKKDDDARSDKGKKKDGPAIELPDIENLTLDGESAETQIELYIQSLLRAISTNQKMKANQVIYYVKELTNTLKKLRSMQLDAMLKNVDAKVVARIIRRFEPDAGELRIIQIFEQELSNEKHVAA